MKKIKKLTNRRWKCWRQKNSSLHLYMKKTKQFQTQYLLFLLVCFAVGCQSAQNQNNQPAKVSESIQKAKIARIWHGRLPDAKADEYEKYLYEEGVKKIEAIQGNLGVQMLRHSQDGITEFTVISYWASKDDINRYAGEDIEKTHNLPKDAEYLLELEPQVKNFDLKVNDWKQTDFGPASKKFQRLK